MSNPSFIGISERAYKYIRQFTIKSIEDALVELITNSIDAYNKTTTEQRLIEIDIFGQKTIKVRDRALGLTSDSLVSCFLQVGNYTADSTSRGFFSRGAKDISALGNLYFNTIKDGKYSQCSLNTDAYGLLTIADVPVTDDIINQLKIPAPFNGLEVTIELLPNFQSINIDNLYNSLCLIGVLRDIVSNSKNTIILRQYDGVTKELSFQKEVKYTYPSGTLLLDLIYEVPNYPGKEAHFVVYKSDKPFIQPNRESEMEFGFLWKDNTTIYEVNTINDRFRWNMSINYIFGYIKCDAIRTYLSEYDTNGPTSENPYPIIDPSRITGVNKQHPFIIQLLSIPLTRIDLILRELNGQLSSKQVTIEDVDQLLDELSKYGISILESEDVEVNFVPNYDSKLAKAIEDDRAKYVKYEQSKTITGNYDTELRTIDNYIKDEIEKLDPISGNIDGQNYYILDSKNNLIQIQTKDTNVTNDPITILDLIPSENINDLKKNPYIYTLSDTHELVKLYIFQKGALQSPDNNTLNNIISKNKLFKIEFINDLNSQTRYTIDSTNGVQIKININNSIVRRYLTSPSIDALPTDIKLTEISSTKSLMFFKELMTDIIATIIVESDINNGKLSMDGSGYTNAKKVHEYYNKIVSKVEVPINNILGKYINNNTNTKLTKLNTTITEISTTIKQMVSSIPEAGGQLLPLEDLIRNDISKLIE